MSRTEALQCCRRRLFKSERSVLFCSDRRRKTFFSKGPPGVDVSGWFPAPKWVFLTDNMVTSSAAGLELAEVED